MDRRDAWIGVTGNVENKDCRTGSAAGALPRQGLIRFCKPNTRSVLTIYHCPYFLHYTRTPHSSLLQRCSRPEASYISNLHPFSNHAFTNRNRMVRKRLEHGRT